MPKTGYVAIIGRPNSGKSTLLNSLLGTRLSIVTPKAQTTRDRIAGIFTEPQGQIVFIDTPGVHRAKEGGINSYMVREARIALESAQLVWYLVDPASELEHEEPVLEILKAAEIPICLVLNKIDSLEEPLLSRSKTLIETLESRLREAGVPSISVFRISGKKKMGTQELLSKTWEILPEGPAYYSDSEQISDRPVRFLVAEMIREQLFFSLGDEVPYSCAIEIEKFDEKSQPLRIEAVIFVERESQKGIVIGQAGKKIKEIGQGSREKIETFLGHKVFLGLRVKLLKDWTKTAEGLRRLGYL